MSNGLYYQSYNGKYEPVNYVNYSIPYSTATTKSWSCSTVLPEIINEEVKKNLRVALMNESFIADRFRANVENENEMKLEKENEMKLEIKRKTGKKGSCVQFTSKNAMGWASCDRVIEIYGDMILKPEAIVALIDIMSNSSIAKLIFRDSKVIAVSLDKRPVRNEEDGSTVYKHKSYIADCMEADLYDPLTGAIIAMSKCMVDKHIITPSKSKIKRIYKQIEQFYTEENA